MNAELSVNAKISETLRAILELGLLKVWIGHTTLGLGMQIFGIRHADIFLRSAINLACRFLRHGVQIPEIFADS